MIASSAQDHHPIEPRNCGRDDWSEHQEMERKSLKLEEYHVCEAKEGDDQSIW